MMSSVTTCSFNSLLCLDGGPAGLFENTQDARNDLLRELSNVQVVKIKDFLQLILPLQPLTDSDTSLPAVSDIIQELKDSRALVPTDITDSQSAETIFRWADFNQSPSKMEGVHETVVFNRMLTIVDQIKGAVAARHGPSPTMSYMDEPNRPGRLSHRKGFARPDGYFYFDPDGNLSRAEARNWYNIGVVAEFKKNRSPQDIHDNVHKILWGMNHMMCEDPTRRHTLGFTIEDCAMTLWYCDRSQVVASTAFDFILMLDLLIDFFLRVMYAPRSSLGCDPTMELITTAEDGPPKYKITIYDVDAFGQVTPHQYIASTLVNNSAKNGIATRGTRVWSARELDGEKRQCVIKDYWVGHDRDAEGDILAWIKNTFSVGNPHYNTLHRHLPTVLSHGKVPRDAQFPLVADATLDIPASSRVVDKSYWTVYLDGVIAMARISTTNAPTQYEPTSLVDRFEKDIVQDGRRSHFRTAFAEEGEPLHQITSLGTVFSVLSDIAECLTALHTAGWVHHDLSTGNILVVRGKDGPRGVLADFEYAKHRDDTREAPSARIGTLHFMSVEVDLGEYLFSSESDRSRVEFHRDPTAGIIKGLGSLFAPPDPAPPFRYHPLNDWESIFWIAMHFTIDREVKEVAAIVGDRLEDPDVEPQTEENWTKQMSWARQLFYERGARYSVFNSMVCFTDMNRCVHDAMRPLALWQLEIMRLALVDGYKSVEIGRKPPTFEDSANSNAALLIKEPLEWHKIYLTESAHIVIGPFGFKRPSLA